MRLRVGGGVTDVNLRGTVWDAADFLASLTRTNLRSFIAGPWGDGDEDLAAEMARRCSTAPCQSQCFIVQHEETGGKVMTGCSCSSGWQYTDDNHVQTLEGCGPNDVWNDARALVANHAKVGRASADPILCDCDDLTAICAAIGLYSAWKAQGSPRRRGLPVDPEGIEMCVCITKPRDSQMAHAFIMSNLPAPRERQIKVDGLYVFDPAERWGMKAPADKFYGSGDVAPYPVRLSDLLGRGRR